MPDNKKPMTVGDLTAMLVNIRLAGRNAGFTDEELGRLPIVSIKDNHILVKEDFNLEIAQMKGEKGYVALLTRKLGSGLLAL